MEIEADQTFGTFGRLQIRQSVDSTVHKQSVEMTQNVRVFED